MCLLHETGIEPTVHISYKKKYKEKIATGICFYTYPHEPLCCVCICVCVCGTCMNALATKGIDRIAFQRVIMPINRGIYPVSFRIIPTTAC